MTRIMFWKKTLWFGFKISTNLWTRTWSLLLTVDIIRQIYEKQHGLRLKGRKKIHAPNKSNDQRKRPLDGLKPIIKIILKFIIRAHINYTALGQKIFQKLFRKRETQRFSLPQSWNNRSWNNRTKKNTFRVFI